MMCPSELTYARYVHIRMCASTPQQRIAQQETAMQQLSTSLADTRSEVQRTADEREALRRDVTVARSQIEYTAAEKDSVQVRDNTCCYRSRALSILITDGICCVLCVCICVGALLETAGGGQSPESRSQRRQPTTRTTAAGTAPALRIAPDHGAAEGRRIGGIAESDSDAR